MATLNFGVVDLSGGTWEELGKRMLQVSEGTGIGVELTLDSEELEALSRNTSDLGSIFMNALAIAMRKVKLDPSKVVYEFTGDTFKTFAANAKVAA